MVGTGSSLGDGSREQNPEKSRQGSLVTIG